MNSLNQQAKLLVISLCMLTLGLLPPNTASATTLTAGPYLQRASATAITIRVRTDVETQIAVRYRVVGADTWKKTNLSDTATKHRFRLTSLRPGTTYEYYLRDNQQRRMTPTTTFATNHTIDKSHPLRMAVVGDSGTNTIPQYQIAAQILASNPELILHTGDIAYYSGTTEEFLSEVFTPYQALLSHILFYGTPGNHDFETENAGPYKDFFESPTGYDSTRDYYAFDYDSVHIVSMNSNIDYSVGSAQYNWLKADLKKAKKNKALWTIVFFHHPVYSSGMHGTTPGMAETLSPLFEQYGVDLVLNGHDHNYERMEAVNGVNYLVTGGGGSDALYNQDHPELNPYTAKFISTYHFMSVVVRKKTIELQAIDRAGQRIDAFKIKQDHSL